MRLKAAFLAIIVSLTISGCATNVSDKDNADESAHVEAAIDAISEQITMDTSLSNTERSMILLEDLYSKNNGNVVISPMSLNFSLGMISNGAGDDVQKKLDTYLGDEDFNNTALSILSKYGEGSDDKNVFCIADSVWVDDAKVISQEFKRMAESFYGAEISRMNVSDPEGSADEINHWCAEKTKRLIPKIVEVDDITPDTSTVLLNTVYLNAEWENRWDETDCEFTDLYGQKSLHKMFTGDVEKYYKNDKATGFGTYYKNGLEFIGILPEARFEDDLDFRATDLSIDDLLKSGCSVRDIDKEVIVKIPSFKYSTDNKCLKRSLTALGLGDIFDSGKDPFSRLLEDGKETHISDIIQKCTIDVQKNGTEASAATATIMKSNSLEVVSEKKEIIEIDLNRPFLYLIIEPATRQIVFAGKVVNADFFRNL